MRGSNEKMIRSSLVVTCHGRRGSCAVMTADGPASSLTAAEVPFDVIAYDLHCKLSGTVCSSGYDLLWRGVISAGELCRTVEVLIPGKRSSLLYLLCTFYFVN